MIEVKLFELRDEGTFIPVFAARMLVQYNGKGDAEDRERWLLRRAGYSPSMERSLVLLTRLDGGKSQYDPYGWGQSRTWVAAHEYIERCWHDLTSGDLLDVRVILGETENPCPTEQGLA